VLGGELHIPGWSDYLHPMDEDHLLAVGIDGTLQVSLFDISDFENPALQDRLFLDAWGSEAQWEPHAFNYFPPTESLSMPVSDYDDIALQVVHADAEGLGDLGKLYQPEEMLYDTDAWCAPIRRSVVMDEVVWAVSSAGLTAAAVADPTTVVASVDFTGVDPCADEYYDYYYYW